ncbi:MAG: 50S ribosomal protein L34 [Phycisphaerales bacterium]|nr:50S ribosomal protein L34 [Planctomycetota bacterium]MCH8508972.1 50S ribosomal protein L34 [Phycisphaerales bacterium]
MAIHYPRRTSKVKRRRRFGFRARMKTKAGRALINRRRRIGRKINVD